MELSQGTVTLVNPDGPADESGKTYGFDAVFDERCAQLVSYFIRRQLAASAVIVLRSSSQLQVYTQTARPIVNSCLEGYNGTSRHPSSLPQPRRP